MLCLFDSAGEHRVAMDREGDEWVAIVDGAGRWRIFWSIVLPNLKPGLAALSIITALGVPNYLKAEMVKDGAVVINVGITRVEDKTLEKGYRITGDVDFEMVSKKASHITPVPGGVGPMTIAVLLRNTLVAAHRNEAIALAEDAI